MTELLRMLVLCHTGLNAICVKLFEILGDRLDLLRRTTCNRPFQIRGKVLDNVL